MRLPASHWCAIVVATASLLAAASAAAQSLADKVDEYMAGRMKVHHFSGAILIARDAKVLVSKGYGQANFEHKVPNTPRTIFRLGSITKQFTAMAILQLQEAGKISVQDPICKYLENCPEAWQPVTIHHLLTHTSGIPSYTGMPDYRNRMRGRVSTAEMVARFRDKPLEFAVGDKFKYNNSGYFLLGVIIEKASSERYEDFLRKNVFEPLGMKNTGYDHSDAVLANRAAGYSRMGDRLANAAFLDMSQPYSAGSLYSTVEDLWAWEQALAAGKLISPDSYKALFTPFKENYAYGWAVGTRFNRKTIGHGGGINGFSTYIQRYPEEKVCVIVLSNLESGNAGRVSRDLEAIVFGEKYELPRERVAIKLDTKLYDAYTGIYEIHGGLTLTITRQGDRLFAQSTGQPQAEIFPESETKFFLRVVDVQITFVKDKQGNVTHAIVHSGAEERAKKVQ